MTLLELVFFYIANFSFAWIITQSVFFEDLRYAIEKLKSNWFTDKLDYFINCIFCMSFWTSIPLSFLFSKTYQSWSYDWHFIAILAVASPAMTMICAHFLFKEEELND